MCGNRVAPLYRNVRAEAGGGAGEAAAADKGPQSGDVRPAWPVNAASNSRNWA